MISFSVRKSFVVYSYYVYPIEDSYSNYLNNSIMLIDKLCVILIKKLNMMLINKLNMVFPVVVKKISPGSSIFDFITFYRNHESKGASLFRFAPEPYMSAV